MTTVKCTKRENVREAAISKMTFEGKDTILYIVKEDNNPAAMFEDEFNKKYVTFPPEGKEAPVVKNEEEVKENRDSRTNELCKDIFETILNSITKEPLPADIDKIKKDSYDEGYTKGYNKALDDVYELIKEGRFNIPVNNENSETKEVEKKKSKPSHRKYYYYKFGR